MSIRTLAASAAVVASLLAAPAASVAYPVHDVGSAGSSQAGFVAPQSAPSAPALRDSGGTGTVLVVAIAGATLLIGAAGGFESGRVVTRRHPVS